MIGKDSLVQFNQLLIGVKNLVNGVFPAQNQSQTASISLSNLEWTNVGRDRLTDFQKHKQVKQNNGTFQAKLTATVTLTKNGKVVDKETNYPILTVPHITSHGTYIIEGKEVQVVGQLRLRPGVYTYPSGDNQNVEAFLNTTASKTLKVILNRDTGICQLRVGTGAHTPIYSALKAVGATDEEIRNALSHGETGKASKGGKSNTPSATDLFDINYQAADPQKDIPQLLLRLRPSLRTIENAIKLGAPLLPATMADTNKTNTSNTPNTPSSGNIVPATKGDSLNIAKYRENRNDPEGISRFSDIRNSSTISIVSSMIQAFLESKPMDPEVNKLIIGIPADRINKDVMLAAVKNVVAVTRGDREADDRESLAFKSIYRVADFVEEKLERALPSIRAKIRFELDRSNAVKDVVPPHLFSDPIFKFFTTSELARYSDQNNPLDMAAVQHLVTVMGDGGIASTHAVTDEVRAVHPSHYGILDPLHTPEGASIGTTSHLASGIIVRDKKLFLRVYNAKTGAIETKSVTELMASTVAFPDQYQIPGDYSPIKGAPKLKPRSQLVGASQDPNIPLKVKVRRNTQLLEVTPSEVEYIFLAPEQFFSSTTSAVPFINSNHANRVLMGDKHIEQAVPLLEPDAPLVQARSGLTGYEEKFGKDLIIKAVDPSSGLPLGGKVVSITPDYIDIKPTGKPKYRVPLRNHYPLKSNAFIHDTPVVRVGDEVKPGQMLAENNFTKGGVLALGKNLTVAYAAYGGHTFEDGIAISESAAKKLTSVHKYEFELKPDKETKIGRLTYLAHFPSELSHCPEDAYSEDGIIKVGTIVKPDQILVPAIKRMQVNPDFDLGRLHRMAGLKFADVSIKWDGEVECEVVDVKKSRYLIKIYVKTKEPLQVGDKLCFTRDHKVWCSDGTWKSVDDFVNIITGGLLANNPQENITRGLLANNPQENITRGLLANNLQEKIASGLLANNPQENITRGLSANNPQENITGGLSANNPQENITGGLSANNLRVATYNTLTNLIEFQKIEQVHLYPKSKVDLLLVDNPILSMAVTLDHRLYVTLDINKPFEFITARELLDRLSANNPQENITSGLSANNPQENITSGLSANNPNATDGFWISAVSTTPAQLIHRTPPVHYIRIPKYQVRVETREEMVWCLSTNNGTLITSHNNTQSHITGNSLRAGAKGIVSVIIPDEEMYRDKEGNIIDILYNPFTVPGRVNPGQMFEPAAGKLAKKTGKVFYADNFRDVPKEGMLKYIQTELKKAGVEDSETIVNPKTGHKIDDVLVGTTHIVKLKHQVSHKFRARASVGAGYDTDQQPTKGGDDTSQRVGTLLTFSLLSADANEFLKDAYGIKSQKNDEYWRALQAGLPTPPVNTPYVEEKFIAMLLAAGINLQQEGSRITAAPLTDKEVLSMSSGEIKQPLVVNAKNLKPEAGGLFDQSLTGGVGGKSWTHIALPVELVHPLMWDAVQKVGNFKSSRELERLINHQEYLDITTLKPTEAPKPGEPTANKVTGGAAVKLILSQVDVDKSIRDTIAEIRVSKGAKLNDAYKRLRYLRALRAAKLKPDEAYVVSKLPVIPPKFRQISVQSDGTLSVADANHTYREVLLIKNQIEALTAMGVEPDLLKDLYLALNDAVRGVVGTDTPLTRPDAFRGFVAQIKGSSPKFGYFQRKVSSRTQDLSARSTIIPNPDLHMDEVGIPREMAATIYRPFLVRRLGQQGLPPVIAKSRVDKYIETKGKVTVKGEDGSVTITQDTILDKALELEMSQRPVLLNRDPALHKFSVTALKPRLIDGKAVEINPLIVAGLNADFDGDTSGIHVPVSEAARTEALTKLLPSQNLYTPQTNTIMHAPSKEALHGVYLLTKPVRMGAVPNYPTFREAYTAYQTKQIKANQEIKVGELPGTTTCIGQWIYRSVFPGPHYPQYKTQSAKDILKDLDSTAKQSSHSVAADTITKVKDLGNLYVTEIGVAVSLRDLVSDTAARDAIIAKADKAIKANPKDFSKAADEASKSLSQLLRLAVEDSRFVEASIGSGALGKADSVKQLMLSPVAVEDHKGKVVPVLLRRSFSEGFDLGSYLATIPGARKGLVDKGLSVADTGYLSRLLVNTNIENRIVSNDCNTTKGIDLPLTEDADIHDRYGAVAPYRNQLMTAELVRRLMAKKVPSVTVRSPLTCTAVGGICQLCYGLNEVGQLPRIGFHVGALAAQTVGERATQITLKSFHTGGVIGGPKLGFDRIKELLMMPQNIDNKATIAALSGTVTRIEPGPTGGFHVYIDKQKHFVPKEFSVRVRVGDRVAAGDLLSSSGSIKPQELLEVTGDVRRTQNYLIDELSNNYRAAGANIRRKMFETTIQPLTTKVKVTDAGSGTLFFNVVPGDITSVNIIEDYNEKIKAKGGVPIQYEPLIAGIMQIPHYSEDFLGTLIHDRLKSTLERAPTTGMSSDLTKGHPVTRLSFTGFKGLEAVKWPLGRNPRNR